MKVTPELLKKYHRGECSEEERQLVERWLENDEVEKAFPADEKLPKIKSEMWASISTDLNNNAPTLPLFRSVSKYAAAISILLVTFLGGRYSANTANAHTHHEDTTANHIFITGGNGAYGNLPGDNFKIGFDGIIKLYNNSSELKMIQIGDTSFTLAPKTNYYLDGNTDNPKLSYNKYCCMESYHRAQPL